MCIYIYIYIYCSSVRVLVGACLVPSDVYYPYLLTNAMLKICLTCSRYVQIRTSDQYQHCRLSLFRFKPWYHFPLKVCLYKRELEYRGGVSYEGGNRASV